MNSSVVFQIRNVLTTAQSLLIALPENADDDTVGAGLALYLTLIKLRKQASIIAPHDVRVAQSHFFGIDKITKELAGSNALVISFPYKEGSIETINRSIEGNRFNIIIEPRGGPLMFSPEEIEYTFGRGDYDTVIVMGAAKLEDLGSLYKKHGKMFTQKSVINIDNHRDNAQFGQINIVEDAPLSQTMTTLFRALRIPIDQDPASNLYTGIMSVAPSFQLDTVSPDALEALAFLMRAKAELLKTAKPALPKAERLPRNDRQTQPPVSNPQQVKAPQDNEAPEDWLKPKIFSSRNN